jgi:glycogen debranching enzyme
MPKLLHEGTSFLISDAFGNIHPNRKDSSGLFYEDSRFLSQYEMTLDGNSPVFLSSDALSDSETRYFLSNGALPCGKSPNLPQDNLVIVRTQRLSQGFHERIEITQDGDGDARFTLGIALGADFEHIYFVKESSELGSASMPSHHVLHQVVNRGRSLQLLFQSGRVYRKCLVHFGEKPKWKNNCALFPLMLKRGQCWALEVDVEMINREKKVGRKIASIHPSKMREAKAKQFRREIEEGLPVLETDHPVLKHAFEAACQDMISLRIKATEALPGSRSIAAGIPWYMALFGRDSLITSCQSLWIDPILAQGTLRSLAYLQGKRHDPVSLEDPGKILHEYRESLIAGHHKAIPKFPYYGTVDATPLFVITLSEYCRWTGDLSLARELWPNVEAALRWMRTEGDPDRDGFIEYGSQQGGLANQGWKDSGDSVRFADGSLAQAPIALIEVQGYKIAALRRAAELARHLRKTQDSLSFDSEAKSLAKQLIEKFWIKERSFFAEALDHSKTPVDSVTSNPGHLLWCESIEPRYAKHVANRLFKPDMFSGYGVRTMGADEGGYNPVSYHNGSVWPHDNSLILAGLMNYGYRKPACALAEALLKALAGSADGRFSELFSGFAQKRFNTLVGYPSACKPQAWASGAVIMILKQVLGIRANAFEKSFEIHPLPLKGMSYLRLCGLRFNGRVIDIDTSGPSQESVHPRKAA